MFSLLTKDWTKWLGAEREGAEDGNIHWVSFGAEENSIRQHCGANKETKVVVQISFSHAQSLNLN